MFSFTLSDKFSDIRCIVFPSDAEANASQIQNDNVVLIEGALQSEEEEDRQLIIRNIMSKDQILSTRPKVMVTVKTRTEQDMLLDYVKKHQGKTRIVLLANGKEYPIKGGMRLTAGGMDWLKQNFQEVSCG